MLAYSEWTILNSILRTEKSAGGFIKSNVIDVDDGVINSM